jgi:fucose 4-O-acetylase-like acetyltransferase
MMPFFFLISGYNYKPGVLSYGASVRKRARQLLVPSKFSSPSSAAFWEPFSL